MSRTPAHRTPRAQTDSPRTAPGSPIEIRLVGHEADVQRLVAAMQASAYHSTGPLSYRPSRYTEGALRAYLTLVIPPAKEQP